VQDPNPLHAVTAVGQRLYSPRHGKFGTVTSGTRSAVKMTLEDGQEVSVLKQDLRKDAGPENFKKALEEAKAAPKKAKQAKPAETKMTSATGT